MWESPIYRFKADINGRKKEILVDVTGSAPNFTEPGSQLEGAFKVLLKDYEPSKTQILDFGAAKLRNTLYLLKNGFNVYSCEFNDLFKRSRQAADLLNDATSFPNFKKLVFPKDFIDFDRKFDVVLLINVLNIMPVPLERLLVLALCRERMREGSRLFWYTQHGAYVESSAVGKLYDGIVTGRGRKYHMFYRDFSRLEIQEMLISTGFSLNKELTFPTSGSNQAYTFNADGDVLVDTSLGLTELLKRKARLPAEKIDRVTRWKTDEKGGKSEKITYEATIPKSPVPVQKANILEGYSRALARIKKGPKLAHRYHQLIFAILRSVFSGRLQKPRMEEPIAHKSQRVDITFQNHRERGFFRQLAEGYRIVCPNIFIECKNYTDDIANEEFAQLQNRLNSRRGQFGILVCRSIDDQESLETRQRNLVNDGKYVLVLVDSDIQKLIKMKLKDDDAEIDDFLEERFKALI